MDEQRREVLKRAAQEQAQARGSKCKWVLVDVEKLPVFPEVQQARDEWEGQEVSFLTPWGQWRRGQVKHIHNSGAASVVVYQKGTPGGLRFAFAIEHIPVLLRHAGS